MNKALFIVLDEVLITSLSGGLFPLHTEDWKFTAEWFKVFKPAIDEGFKICLVDNQFNVGANGYIHSKAFNTKIETICEILEKDLSLAPNSIITSFNFNEDDVFRSIPNPGLMYEVAVDHEINLRHSYFIGKTEEHELFALNSGIGTYFDFNDL